MNMSKYPSNTSASVNDHIQGGRKRRLNPFLVIWRGLLQFIAGLAVRAGEVEIGGELYGLLSHADRPVIMLATPAGPGAIREKARFCQDIEFMKNTNAYLSNNWGIQYLGNWHSHGNLGLKGLSEGDIRSTHSIAKKNRYKSMCQIVLTFEDEPAVNCQCDPNTHNFKGRILNRPKSETEREIFTKVGFRLNRPVSEYFQPEFIRVHAFVYSDPSYGQPRRCPIKTLPGTSPFRHALRRKPGVSELMISHRYPFSRIIFDLVESPPEPIAQSLELPQPIQNQCLLMSENAQQSIEVVFKKSLVLLSLGLPKNDGDVIVAYQSKRPYKVEAVYLLIDRPARRQPMDITSKALRFGPHTRLPAIYNQAVRLLETEDTVAKLKTPTKRTYRFGKKVGE